MVFESIKRWFGKGKYEETPDHKMQIINEELDEFEKEIQEYISYTEKENISSPSASQPEILSQGGGMKSGTLITPEEEKRIEGTET